MVDRSEAPADPRPYVRVSTDLPTHPKLEAIDNPSAGWAYVVSLCYSAQSFTDGHFPLKGVCRIANVEMAVATALAEQGLWHLPGHDCADCDQPKAGHAVVHDYLQHQRSAAEVHELTEKRRAAGRKGAESRWAKPKTKPSARPPGSKPMASAKASAIASAMANGQQDLWQNDGKPMAEERRGEEIPLPSEEGAPAAAAAPSGNRSATRNEQGRRGQQGEEAFHAGHVVAAFHEGAKEKNRTVPPDITKQVGAQAKKLIADGSVPQEQLLNAAREMGRQGWKDLNMQLYRGSEQGGFTAKRVNTSEPGSHTAAWERRRAAHAQQQ
ncbi:hypothetical protein [Micromonospora sp. NPDC050695]|uniref:hypothetical protein n=1 Tax=Micromonospora sp. NPDC050695 TaxID=3154938 RepID=UPI0034030FCB